MELIYNRPRDTAFGRLTNVNTVYSQLAATQKTANATAAAVKPKASSSSTTSSTKKELTISGTSTGTLVKFQPNGFYFGVKLDFALAKQEPFGSVTPAPSPGLSADEKADWGTGFGNPLVGPKKNCVYVVRATIDQLRVDPMIGGFKLKWVIPAGWRAMDPMPLDGMLVEASSNPILLARKFISPNTKIKNVVFRVLVTAWYP
ncbi:MAG: hypothetical protein ACOYB2_10635 [Limnohabitans sp.]